MIEIDDFKENNDQSGQLKGNKFLVTIGGIIKKNVREMDISARYCGEDLVVIMPQCLIDDARLVAERIHLEIENNNFFDGVSYGR